MKETILTVLFFSVVCVVIYLLLDGKIIQHKQGNEAKMDSLEKSFTSLTHRLDTFTFQETNITKKITIINNHYDSTKTNIFYLSDSAQFSLLLSNIERFEYLSESSPSQGH